MGVRAGKSYILGLKAHPRDVWIAGRKVGDVTTDPAFRRPIAAMAALYDCQIDAELRATMTYRPQDGDADAGLSFIIPRTQDDLVRRRKAMRVWADASFGTMGRSPDFLNTVLASFADEPGVFAECGAKFADNVQRYYRYCRDNDLRPPTRWSSRRSTAANPPSQQADAYAYLGIVGETGRRHHRPRRQDAGDARPDRRRADGLSAAVLGASGRGEICAGLRHPCRHARLAIHLPRAVRPERSIGMGSPARLAFRGARRRRRVQRRAGAMGSRIPARQRGGGEYHVRAHARAMPHRTSDGGAWPRQMRIHDRAGGCPLPQRQDRRLRPRAGAARRMHRLSAADRGRRFCCRSRKRKGARTVHSAPGDQSRCRLLRYHLPRFYERMVRSTKCSAPAVFWPIRPKPTCGPRSAPTSIATFAAPTATPKPTSGLSKPVVGRHRDAVRPAAITIRTLLRRRSGADRRVDSTRCSDHAALHGYGRPRGCTLLRPGRRRARDSKSEDARAENDCHEDAAVGRHACRDRRRHRRRCGPKPIRRVRSPSLRRFLPGGPSDALARILSGPLQAALGPAGRRHGMSAAPAARFGVGRVTRAEPDGYTLFDRPVGHQVVNPVTYNLDLRCVMNDLAPIALPCQHAATHHRAQWLSGKRCARADRVA